MRISVLISNSVPWKTSRKDFVPWKTSRKDFVLINVRGKVSIS